MTISRNLSILAEGASSSGVLAVTNGGTGVTTSTGSGNVVLSASPTFSGTISFPGSTTVDSSGNVGIGTSSPANFSGTVKLVVGSAATTTTAGAVTVYSGTATYGGLYFADGTVGDQLYRGAVEYNHSTDALLMYSAGSERARIDSSGNLLVGRTSLVSPSGLSTANVQSSLGYSAYNGTNAAQYPVDRISFNSSNFYVVNASSTGVVLVSGNTSWAAQSDERLKDIIEPIADAVDKVSTLRAVIGRYKADDDSKRRAFLMAQDVQAVLPEAVSEDADGHLLLGYSETIPLLVAAIQELSAKNDALEARLAKLEPP